MNVPTDKTIAFVLGGTAPHIELIKQLHNRGYYVVLIDYLANPPAKSYADEHLVESTLDLERVVELARLYGASLVISACVDQANITACYVAERLGLSKPYSYATATAITNKASMKETMLTNGIPTTRYVAFSSEATPLVLPSSLRFPVVVKPVDSCAASGVKIARSQEEFRTFIAEAKRVSRTGRTLVEEYFSGVEVSAYCFVQNKRAQIVMVSERVSVVEGKEQVLKCYSTVTPPNISDAALRTIEEAAQRVASAYGLDNTPLHFQAIVNGDEISTLEYAPRVGGGLSYRTILDGTGFDFISASIDSYLNVPTKVEIHPLRSCCAICLLYGTSGIFARVEGVEELKVDQIIEDFFYHKTPGMVVSPERASSSRLGAFIVRGKSRSEIVRKVEQAMKRLEAYDQEGRSILRKDLYLKN